ALLGASRVHGVDNDPQAIVATLDNSHRNNIDDAVLSACLPEALPQMQADILLANILAEPLLQLAEKFSLLLKPGGKIVLSGLLREQADTLLNTYARWFVMDTPAMEMEWVRLSGTRCG
ncbi:MAG: 50S ribosomal protein L11 methyltransferase, partial [Proteobacteria bacterium]|nr:50S ribosomal protein L11 methyltransferase [Pseudomonadota bacterium]